MADLVMDTTDAGKPVYINKARAVVIGKFQAGRSYVRVRLLERSGCHLADDVVDYGAEWVLSRNA